MVKLLFDGRYISADEIVNSRPLFFCWHFDIHQQLIVNSTKISALPKLTKLKHKHSAQPLAQVLGLQPRFNAKEPQTLETLRHFLSSHNVQKNVIFYYVFRLRPKAYTIWFSKTDSNNPSNILYIEVFPTFNFSLAYRPFNVPKIVQNQGQKLRQLKLDAKNTIASKVNFEPNDFCNNKRTSTFIRLVGLSLAFQLNVCPDKATLCKLSHAVAQTCGSLWLQFDDKKFVRHVTYSDAKISFSICLDYDPIVIDSEQNNVDEGNSKFAISRIKQWKNLFNVIKKQQNMWIAERQTILQPLLDRLKHHKSVQPKISSPWTKCIQQLEQAVKEQQLYVFCSDDTVLHNLKIPLAHMTKATNSKANIAIKTTGQNTISVLSTSGFKIINLANYLVNSLADFNLDTDDVCLWQQAKEWLSPHEFDTFQRIESLHLNHNNTPTMGKLDFCLLKQLDTRGCVNNRLICILWQKFNQFMLKQFNLDIATSSLYSLSSIAFKCVWLKYANIAGPLSHPIENLTAFNERVMRQWSRGGYCYSMEGKIEEGQDIFPEIQNTEKAHTIVSYDITSCYGYCASTMKVPTGFAITFNKNKKCQSIFRHKGFEFLAVFFTIFKWITNGRSIRTLFSNFSHFGVLSIHNYPIDLVAIMEDGLVEMVQMDGAFCHGCYQNPACPSLSRYIQNMTRQQVEEKTKLRDQFILDWIRQQPQQVYRYNVITDCCTPHYSKKELNNVFKREPPLSHLIQGYDECLYSIATAGNNPNLNKHLLELCPKSMMFFAVVTGRVPENHYKHQKSNMGPLFVWENQKQHTTFEGTVFLTSDYYEYLKTQHQFQVDTVEWIIFYKKCPHFSKVFQTLIEARNNAGMQSSQSKLYKNIINFCCGYFGLNTNKQLSSSRTKIVTQLPKNFNPVYHLIKEVVNFNNETFYILTTTRKILPVLKMSNTPLPIFINIIEFGKMRLNQILYFFATHFRPYSYKICYINIDSIVAVLSRDSLFQLAIAPESIQFQSLFTDIFLTNNPGSMKLEWTIPSQTEWKFISPFIRCYAIRTNTDLLQKHKISSLKAISSDQAYQTNEALLNKQTITINQLRRVDKQLNTKTQTIPITFHPKI